MPEPFEYDVFLSYSHRDEEWVIGELLTRLERAGLSVCIDYRDFELGVATVIEIERALTFSRKTILVLTGAYVESEWAAFEMVILQTIDPTNRGRRLIPLVKETCELPRRIQALTNVSFVDSSKEKQAWTRLLGALIEKQSVDLPASPAGSETSQCQENSTPTGSPGRIPSRAKQTLSPKRRALIFGLNHYQELDDLRTPAKGAHAMARLLSRHEDGSYNYECRLFTDKTLRSKAVTIEVMRRELEDLFSSFRGDVLLYFSGYITIKKFTGYLVARDGTSEHWGIAIDDVLALASKSEANDILVIFDCYYSNKSTSSYQGQALQTSNLREDMTVIASLASQDLDFQNSGYGYFPSFMINALEGGAADPMGWITAPAIYSWIERNYSTWSQRPRFVSNLTRSAYIRKCSSLLKAESLWQLTDLFPEQGAKIQLDPGHEGIGKSGRTRANPDSKKQKVMILLREYLAAGLVHPLVRGQHLYHTALTSGSVELTDRGRLFWGLVKLKKI